MYELGFIIGLIIVYLSTKILKYAIKEPRPIKGFNDFGMPSTSSAIVTFSVIYSYLIFGNYWVFGIPLIFSVIYMKNYLNHHTLSQTLVGTFVGLFFATTFIYWHSGVDHGNNSFHT